MDYSVLKKVMEYTHIERLLNYAGSHCINANYVIELLEDPDICTTILSETGSEKESFPP